MNLKKVSLLIEQFEQASLPKEEWTHTAHCIVALWYCIKFPLPQAAEKIRNGIKAYNVSIGGANTDTSGYHETITLFYMTTIACYLATTGVTELTDEQIDLFLQQPFLERDHVFRMYSVEQLMSKAARHSWTPPDNAHFFHQPISPKSVSSRHGRPLAS